jgi:peptide methionine sulfoxide reductase msrA/msrB
MNYIHSLLFTAVGLLTINFVISDAAAPAEENNMRYNKLNSAEERVIVDKGTERPFSGKYYQNKDYGAYICKRCNAPLYSSEDKFDAHCGWPSFDDEIAGAIKRVPDADGLQTEIICNNCGAHLGHVFTGEKMTEKNMRHCVNSISLTFVPAQKEVETEKAYFAGGCFWGVEHLFNQTDGIISTRVGYMGGQKQDPTYREVCGGTTGHTEAIEVIYNPAETTYEKLARLFFEIHDPTQVNRQGPDIGEQYRSAIFYRDEDQKQTAEKLIKILEGKGYEIATELTPAKTFWEAEDYHQDYYQNRGGSPYCHTRKEIF